MDENWKCIYRSNTEYEVQIRHGMLEENGIVSVMINKKDSSYLFGFSELYVMTEDVLEATKLINELEA